MIVRTYGRRNRSITTKSYSDSAFNDDVSEDGFTEDYSLSQECPREIHNFTFSSSQDSTTPFSFDSPSRDLTILPSQRQAIPSTSSQELTVLPSRKPAIPNSTHYSFDSQPYSSIHSKKSNELTVLPSRKLGNRENFENGDGGFRKSKKAKIGGNVSMGPTVTLMETQEYGEMMEHVDEVNFAMDGLRRGQPVRIRRASLLSLLSICGTVQQRRLLRAHGMAKTIIDAVLGLSFDDSPSNLAAAALFYILTSDGQDDNLLDSPSCISFLIKLLKPLTCESTKNKASTIGSKLLALRKDADVLHDTNKGVESTSGAIMLRVQEILVNCKEMKSRDGNDNVLDKPKLSPKWIALLTMEKACLSTISLEDNSGTMRKTGGSFKEILRELGGLDAVFEVTRSCYSTMEGWLEQSSSSVLESKDCVDLESLVLLLKCLKIMENATFLSSDNQSHLLGMKGKLNCHRSPQSFTELLLRVIKILSGISLFRNSSSSCAADQFCNLSNQSCGTSELPSMALDKGGSSGVLSISSSVRCCSKEGNSSHRNFSISRNSQWLSSGQTGFSKSSSGTTVSVADSSLLTTRVNSSTSDSCNCSGSSRNFNNGKRVSNKGLRMKFYLAEGPEVSEDTKLELLEDSQDPFAFDEDDFQPSKWDLLSGRQIASQSKKSRAAGEGHEDWCQSLMILSQQESCNMENHHSGEASSSSAVSEEKSSLLADCLLAAVKVLMNLTNDNPVGCQQIAGCGGLETLSSLIAGHFPSFSSYVPPFSELGENGLSSQSSIEVDIQNDKHLSDQELDFLVAILGLLVNLVEKDSCNRYRLAAVRVSLPGFEGLEEESGRDVISLLCSIFLANQGAGEAAGDGKQLAWDDEDAVLEGEKEAEKMIVEAYAALLLAFLSAESKSIRDDISGYLPDQNLAILVPVLERFVEFHLTLNMISPETHTTVLQVIESCRML